MALGSVVPSSMQKLWTPLVTIFVEENFWKRFWWGSRPIRVALWKEFLISWKIWGFEIFGTSKESRASGTWSSSCEIPIFMETWKKLADLLQLTNFKTIDIAFDFGTVKNGGLANSGPRKTGAGV